MAPNQSKNAARMASLNPLQILARRRRRFQSPIKSQRQSQFLSLPPELRQFIYDYFLEEPRQRPLAVLTTCRLVYAEAHRIVLNKILFVLNERSIPRLSRMQRNLGSLTQHLRQVFIEVSPRTINKHGASNPFRLIENPLDKLIIKLHEFKTNSYREETTFYWNFMSAFMFRTPKNETGAVSNPFLNGVVGGLKRKAAQMTWTWNPSVEDLEDVMKSCKTKSVRVMLKKNARDSLFQAFVHFGLIDPREVGRAVTVKTTDESGAQSQKKVILAFYDAGVLSYLHMGSPQIR